MTHRTLRNAIVRQFADVIWHGNPKSMEFFMAPLHCEKNRTDSIWLQRNIFGNESEGETAAWVRVGIGSEKQAVKIVAEFAVAREKDRFTPCALSIFSGMTLEGQELSTHLLDPPVIMVVERVARLSADVEEVIDYAISAFFEGRR
jgi:hypothetical protein